MPDLPLLVMGTAAFTVPSLQRLHGLGYPILAVYTQPPRPAGRGQRPRPTAVQEAAERLGLPVRTPPTLRDPGVQAELAGLGAGLGIVGAYGLILPQAVLDAPRLGCINLHASLLPRWRGAAPIQRAILAGDDQSGISIFRMEAGLDTGPVLATAAVPIGPHTTAGSLHDALAALAADMLPGVIEGLAAGTIEARPQPSDGITYAAKLRREEGIIDPAEPAWLIERKLRALNPWPGCQTRYGEERLLLLAGEVVEGRGEPGTVIGLPLTMACGEGAIAITRLQRAGRRPVSAEELQRGFSIPLGARLG
jgi:methionyl-tRNA formyltransferase